MGHQPNTITRRFDALDGSGLPKETPAFHCEIGWRNFPAKHTLSWEFGGTAKPSSVNATLQGTNYHDPERATDEMWFDIGPAADYDNAGDGEPAPKLTFDDAVARGIRVRINSITGGTAPTVRPTYAGLV